MKTWGEPLICPFVTDTVSQSVPLWKKKGQVTPYLCGMNPVQFMNQWEELIGGTIQALCIGENRKVAELFFIFKGEIVPLARIKWDF